MSKTLNTTSIANELKGASAFFSPSPVQKPARKQAQPASGRTVRSKAATTGFSEKEKGALTKASIKDTGATDSASERASTQDNEQPAVLARYQASNHTNTVEIIRRAVKDPGGKTTFVRLTPEEKNRLVDLVYTYKRQGVKTSENELARIAIGCLLEDYQANGKESMLAQVIEALNA
jgi:hypothetical protein